VVKTLSQLDLIYDHIVITWPPPVTEVWGVGDVIGTADIEGMLYYYLEYKALSTDLSIPENGPWVPVTSAMSAPVVNGSLATLDTTIVPDGTYALRLTVNTEDNASYHYIVSPLRVSNARYDAVASRIVDEALNRVETDDDNDQAQVDAARPTPMPTVAPPADNIPRVRPSGVAVNVRRCDLVDNDRCPSIASLYANTFGQVLGVNRAGSWFQIALPSGTRGWVSRTVVNESGDFANVPVRIPPQPLPPAVQPTLAPVTGQPIPNGMSIEGGTAVCGEPFRVLINLGNSGNTPSAAGTLTLQDVNVRTGQTTYTGYGNYPSIASGQNFVVAITATVTTYYNEQHELRAFAAGNQYTMRYTVEQGNCGTSTAPTPASSTQRTFNPSECNLVVNQTGEVYNRAGGEVSVTIAPGTYSAIQVQRIGGVNWYQLALENTAPWVPAVPYIITIQGNCAP
jgi:hypothetical protein